MRLCLSSTVATPSGIAHCCIPQQAMALSWLTFLMRKSSMRCGHCWDKAAEARLLLPDCGLRPVFSRRKGDLTGSIALPKPEVKNNRSILSPLAKESGSSCVGGGRLLWIHHQRVLEKGGADEWQQGDYTL